MTKIFLVLSALLLVASAALGYLNKTKLTDSQAKVVSTEAARSAAQNAADKAKTEQKKAETARGEAESKSAALQTQLTSAQNDATTLKGQLDTANGNITAAQAKVDDLTKALAEAKNGPTPPPTDPGVAKQLDDAKHQLAELQVIKDGLQTRVASAEKQTADLQHQIEARRTGESMIGLRGRVLAVDRNWNFVVLDLGGNRGVNANATMIVQRGGSMVGRIKITTVEPSQSIADIVPNSVPVGVSVQPGDTVVFSGN